MKVERPPPEPSGGAVEGARYCSCSVIGAESSSPENPPPEISDRAGEAVSQLVSAGVLLACCWPVHALRADPAVCQPRGR